MAILTLRIVLGLSFLAIGATKLAGTGHTVEYFAAIGWGQWFRYLTGFLDIAGAALLVARASSLAGALVISTSVGLGALISLTVLRGDPTWGSAKMVSVPLVFTLLAVALAWLARRPPAPAGTGPATPN